jgi:hypothetical protein
VELSGCCIPLRDINGPASSWAAENSGQVHVLPKNIAKDDLVSTMKVFARSLHVRCSHCHDANDDLSHANFASDVKPEKAVARPMIKMTSDLNKKYVSRVKLPDDPAPKPVNCWTCHRGREKPETGPPPPTQAAPSEKK